MFQKSLFLRFSLISHFVHFKVIIIEYLKVNRMVKKASCMSKLEENEYRREDSPVNSKPETADGEYRFKPVFSTEDYTDAHYESADETTVPPRYYTPPERAPKDEKSGKKGHGGRSAGIICAILAAALLGGFCGAAFTGAKLNSRMDALEVAISEQKAVAEKVVQEASQGMAAGGQPDQTTVSAPISPADIYEQAKHQVVGIRTEITVTNFFGMTSSGAVSGSGFILSDDGYILTNYHVVEDAFEKKLDIQVITYDGTSYHASIVGVEAANDVAVLKVDAEGLSASEFGNSDTIRVGDPVYAVGNPLGELEFSMSTGHVSALDRVIQTKENESINMFQIDAAVNEGNSGGPVYDANGKVIGIVTAKYSSSGVEGLGFAIPINDVKSIADDLINKGYVTGKAYMGVSVEMRYNAMYSQYYGMPLGAYIAGVTSGSAADKAGLQSGDIVTAIGEYTVEDYDDLKTALRHFSAFDSTELTVYRAGEELHLPILFDEEKPNQ